jgi:hypothetical protein
MRSLTPTVHPWSECGCHDLLGLPDFGGLGIENLIGDLKPPLAETGSVEVELLILPIRRAASCKTRYQASKKSIPGCALRR